jgi:hypothetical protein
MGTAGGSKNSFIGTPSTTFNANQGETKSIGFQLWRVSPAGSTSAESNGQ